jgi:intracellular sulfur oxidation DsrE/DsrF family protein
MKCLALFTIWSAALLLMAEPTLAQRGPGRGGGFRGGRGPGQGQGFPRGGGFGRGRGGGPGHQHDARHDADRAVFQFLLANHKKIKRSVKELPKGVETLTESSDPAVAAKIKEHVEWMKHRVENGNPIRMRDPLFAELFRHADKIQFEYEDTPRGVRVVETSEDPQVARLIKEHAKVVSGFVSRGFTEAMKNHPVPRAGRTHDRAAELRHPRVAGHGGVVQLAEATQQPREGTKLLVDLTAGGDPAELNRGIEKLAKYLNIYAGGGAEPAELSLAVVFHGDATLAVLDPDAYGQRFQTEGNPNLELLRELHHAGVAMYVCGQSLISKGAAPDQVAVFVDTAVSAVSAVANLQADGYAYLPLIR